MSLAAFSSAVPAPDRRGAERVSIAIPTARDIPALIALINTLAEEKGRLFIEPIDAVTGPALLETHLATIAQSKAEIVLVAKIGGDLVGLVNGTRGVLAVRRGVLEIGIGVLPGYRSHGIGFALLNAVEAWARAAGCHRLSLSVVVSNAPAIRLYRKCGFEVEGMQTGSAMLDGEAIDELLMGKNIGASPKAPAAEEESEARCQCK